MQLLHNKSDEREKLTVIGHLREQNQVKAGVSSQSDYNTWLKKIQNASKLTNEIYKY